MVPELMTRDQLEVTLPQSSHLFSSGSDLKPLLEEMLPGAWDCILCRSLGGRSLP